MSIFAENKADRFAAPTQLPESASEREKWLAANKQWWEENKHRFLPE